MEDAYCIMHIISPLIGEATQVPALCAIHKFPNTVDCAATAAAAAVAHLMAFGGLKIAFLLVNMMSCDQVFMHSSTNTTASVPPAQEALLDSGTLPAGSFHAVTCAP